MVDLSLQLALGHIGNIIYIGTWIFLILSFIPMLAWLIVSIVFWFQGHKKMLKWWGIIFGAYLIFGTINFSYCSIFNGDSYTIAKRISKPMPLKVKVLEEENEGWTDEDQEYYVVQFNPQQMGVFIHHIKDWKYGKVSPTSLIRYPPEIMVSPQDLMEDKKIPMPSEKINGYYFSALSKNTSNSNQLNTTLKAGFLDVKTRTLYIFYDDSRWG